MLAKAAVVLDVLVLRLPRALYFGFRAAVLEATDASAELVSIISGFLAATVFLLLFLACKGIAHRLRLKNPGSIAGRSGAALFWLGIAIDRLVHHSTILEMNVESYRRRTAVARQKPRTGSDTKRDSKTQEVSTTHTA